MTLTKQAKAADIISHPASAVLRLQSRYFFLSGGQRIDGETNQAALQVLLFGEDDNGDYIVPEELASLGGSIMHELMTCLGPRIRRFFIYDESLRPR